MAGIEHGSVTNEEFTEEVARYEYFLSESRSSLTSVWDALSSCLFMDIFRPQNRCFKTDVSIGFEASDVVAAKFPLIVRHVVCDFPASTTRVHI